MRKVATAISVAVIAAVFGCSKKVEIKRDTPQAAVASLIKLYEAGNLARLSDVVEPVVARASARHQACLIESIKALQCEQSLIEASQSGALRLGAYHAPEGCSAKLNDCTCGAKGNTAASGASAFSSTPESNGLKLARLGASVCRITKAEEMGKDDLADVDPSFWDYACSDIPKADHLAMVSVVCHDADDQALTFILHDNAGKWMVAGFGVDTDITLSAYASAASEADSARERDKDLNKDLR